VARKKTTVYVEEDLLRGVRVMAERAGKSDSDIVEEALRNYLGVDVLERVWPRSNLDENEALELAYDQLHRSRK
jgi:metal-responsive CopG/Arc/MetJ family transcriptional regulator